MKKIIIPLAIIVGAIAVIAILFFILN